jgi:SEC-C motif-containing protein
MRSRFSAFARRDETYLLRSWHSRSRPATLDLDGELRWIRLEILGGTAGSLFDAEGTVSFAAHYREAGKAGVLKENSHFSREDGEWRYTGPV